MEKDGKNYYLKMSQTSRNDLGKKLFQSLAAEEDAHLKIFEQIYSTIDTNLGWPELEFTPRNGKELRTLFADASENPEYVSSELGAIQTAMDMENKSQDFYLERAGKATSEIEKKYYTLLAGEERAHHAVLLDYFEYLKNPEQYFTLKERQSLDGG